MDRKLIKEPFWAISIKDTLEVLRSFPIGISGIEAVERRKVFGKNKITSTRRFVKLKIFLNQFKSPLIYILVIAGCITIFLKDYNDAIFIFIAVAVNTLLGFYQENKAENSLSSLSGYLEEKTRVFRDGRLKEVNTYDLVPGDVVSFSSGDKIPADGRIISSTNLLIDESILTGESLPVEKSNLEVNLKASLGDRKAMVYSGTVVVEGVGTAVIVSTGSDTEFGIIASLLTNIKEEATPLQKKINSLAKKLTLLVIIVSSLIFALGLYYQYSIFEMFKMSVAIAVAAIPEGLAIAITVILAVGVEQLAKRKGVVRKLLSAETLGDTSIILTDKTGTLTVAKMNIAKIDVPFLDDNIDLLKCEETILKFAILCTDARVENPEDQISDWKIIGKSLDVSLVKEAAIKFGLKESDIREKTPVLDRLTFNSKNKFSAVKVELEGKEATLLIGAPEVVLKMCRYFDWGERKHISEKERETILHNVRKNALEGNRIISVALSYDKIDLKSFNKRDEFNFLGNILLKDPIRGGVGQVIKEIGDDGIRTVIMTGDHTGTAISVAQELGMNIEKGSVIEQHELDILTDDELRLRLSNVKIFSRISPQSKVRITKIFQESGYVVAMTGDGVNDAPALKQADIGIAVGSGSEVARESADLILLDDSFNTIVSAIDEGRRILQNIRKVLVFCLLSLFDEIILIGGAILLNIPVPLAASQILWVNFIADSSPTVSLSYEDEKNKNKVIRNKINRSSIFDSKVKFFIWVVGTITSLLLFVVYYLLLKLGIDLEISRTFIFATFGVYTLLLLFSVRSLDKNIWEYNPFSNMFANISSFIGLIIMFLAIYTPVLQKLLGTVSLSLFWVSWVFVFSFVCFAIMEVGKLIINRVYIAK